MRITILMFLSFLMMNGVSLYSAEKTNTLGYLYAMAETANLSLVRIASQKRALERDADYTNPARFRQAFLFLEKKEREIGQTAAAKMDTYLQTHPAPIRFMQQPWVTNYRILTMRADSVGFDRSGRFILYVDTAYAIEKEFHDNFYFRYKDKRRRAIGFDLGYSHTQGRTSCFMPFEITANLSRMAFIEFFQ